MPETTTGYPNRPESIGAILDRGVTLYREALPALFGLSFLASLVGNIPTLATAGLPATRAAYTSLQLTLSLLLLPVSLALTIALFVALDRVARGQAPAIGASMGEGWGRLLPVLGAAILYVLVVMVGLMLFVIPGLIVALSMGLFIVAATFDGRGPVGALGTSHRLVWGNWWRTLVVVSVPLLIVGILYLLVGLVTGAVFGLGVSLGAVVVTPVMALAITTVNILIGAAVNPLIYAVLLAQYQDLKLRTHGEDLEARLATSSREP